MGAARKLSVVVDPAHEYIQQAIKEGRCRREDMSLRALTIDSGRFQARIVNCEPEHVRRLHSILKMQGWLAPIAVFEDLSDPRKAALLVADGFSRCSAYERDGRQAIPAYVISGGEQDAVEFAAMANQQNTARRREREDIHRAIEMLYDLGDLWWNRSPQAVANHVGCGRDVVLIVRGRLANQGRPVPEILIGLDGKERPNAQDKAVKSRPTVARHKGSFRATYRGKVIYGASPIAVHQEIDDLKSRETQRRDSLNKSTMTNRLKKHGMVPVFHQGMKDGIFALHRPGFLVTPCDFSPHAFPLATHSLILGRQKIADPTARMIIICHVESHYSEAIRLARAAGFEFMTPDELIESLK